MLLLCLRLFTVSLCAIPIEVIKHLGGADTGQNPRGALTQGGDGFFYGTARDGGRYGYGTVYRISGDGVMTTLYDFDDTKGRFPQGALIPRSDGNFYGTTQYGGAGGNGTVFKVTRSGLLTTVASFSGPNGREPAGGLLLASDGCLYGVTIGGGPQNNGTVFRVQPDDSFSTIASFSYTTNLLEWALDGIGLKPGKPDAELLTRPAIVGDQLTWEYRRDLEKSVTLIVEASVDLEHWFTAGEAGAPAEFKDEPTGQSPPWEFRRATLPAKNGQRAFLRLKAVR